MTQRDKHGETEETGHRGAGESPTELGSDVAVHETAVLGHSHGDASEPTVLGDSATVRAGTIIYRDVVAGDGLNTGHNALIREFTTLGDDVLVGTNTVIDGQTEIGSNVSLQTNVYIPTGTTIGDRVFVGPAATLTNDPYPIRTDVDLVGPTLEDDVSIGANATVLPGVTVGEGAFVAAGAVVTEDVPPRTLAVGTPAKHRALPEKLQGGNLLE
ncbi:acyltransferase [Haloprofundus halobius]|uniref:acyltransferase n=1 Tax=Haloprofundus halobius TaxID=2876194 RepID=UPI001CCF45D7|nr:acyltransferase [Haloprofundus halobius]